MHDRPPMELVLNVEKWLLGTVPGILILSVAGSAIFLGLHRFVALAIKAFRYEQHQERTFTYFEIKYVAGATASDAAVFCGFHLGGLVLALAAVLGSILGAMLLISLVPGGLVGRWGRTTAYVCGIAAAFSVRRAFQELRLLHYAYSEIVGLPVTKRFDEFYENAAKLKSEEKQTEPAAE